MPSVSTSSIITQNLGMKINRVYTLNTETKGISDEYLVDTTNDSCCFPPKLTAEDINPEAEGRIRQTFPQFSDAIHSLIEARRARFQAQAQAQQTHCTIL